MRFNVGMKVRMRDNVTEIMLEAEGLPHYWRKATLTIAKCGSFRDDGRRYRVSRRGFARWMPGSFLRSNMNCMFNKEVCHAIQSRR